MGNESSRGLVGPCPICGKTTKIKLVPANVRSKSSRPGTVGCNIPMIEYVEPRTLSWDCTNEECDQSEGKPVVRSWSERLTDKIRLDLKDLFSEIPECEANVIPEGEAREIIKRIVNDQPEEDCQE